MFIGAYIGFRAVVVGMRGRFAVYIMADNIDMAHLRFEKLYTPQNLSPKPYIVVHVRF